MRRIWKQLSNALLTLFLWIFIVLMFVPLYLALIAASHSGPDMMHAPLPILPGNLLLTNIKAVLSEGLAVTGGVSMARLLMNSFIMACLIAAGKVALALLSAFTIVFFRFPLKKLCFALIFSTMMLPVEVRIVPTFQVIASLGWLNSFAGLTLPLMASATATFLFRQFFKTIPTELLDAAVLDGAGPVRFFLDFILPLSKPQMASLFVIMFVYGWNQYLWPLVMTTNSDMSTMVMGIRYLSAVADQIPQWHYIMTIAWIALLPPCLMMTVLQRWFEKGLIAS